MTGIISDNRSCLHCVMYFHQPNSILLWHIQHLAICTKYQGVVDEFRATTLEWH